MRFWILDFGFWIGTLAAILVALWAYGCNSASDENNPKSKISASADLPAARQNPKSRTESSLHFTDITASTAIDFTTTSGVLPSTEILEVNGSGLALLDYDNDGDLDLFIANGATLDDPENGPGCRLYENITEQRSEVRSQRSENRRAPEIRFRDVTAECGIDVHRWAMGVAVGDYDGDGFDDLFIACYGADVLLRNVGGARFEDVTAAAGVSDDRWSTSAAFGDVDGDGDLDLYVCNYLEFDVNQRPPRAKYKGIDVMAGPHGLKPQHDVLYQNQGPANGGPYFRDITEASGCLPPRAAFGLNVVILDFDGDAKQDIFVANDSMPGFYFHNTAGIRDQGSGIRLTPNPSSLTPAFEEIGVVSGIASNGDGADQAAMGIAIADVDGNRFPDKFTTVFSSDTNTLHLNVDGRFFEDRTAQFGLGVVSRPFLGWATGFFDFDLDGDEDLIMFNGHVYPEATMRTMDSEYAQTPLLFERAGDRFHRVDAAEAGAWLAETHRDRAAAFGDLDRDGDVDIVVSELNGPVRVLRNDAIETGGEAARWLLVELRDDRPGAMNRCGLGAKIELITAGVRDQGLANSQPELNPDPSSLTPALQRRWLFTGGGFQSSSPPIAYFGLSELATMRIVWPDGTLQTLEKVEPNQVIIVERAP